MRLCFTRKLSHSDPAKIVIIKGFGSGTGSVIVALSAGERLELTPYIALAPFIGAFISLILFPKIPSLLFIIAFITMAAGAYLAVEKEDASG